MSLFTSRTLKAVNNPVKYIQSLKNTKISSSLLKSCDPDTSVLSKEIVSMSMTQKTLFELYDEFKGLSQVWECKNLANYMSGNRLTTKGF